MRALSATLAAALALGLAALPAAAQDFDANANSPGRVISAGGLVFTPYYFAPGHGEFGAAVGAVLPQGTVPGIPGTTPFGLVAAGGAMSEGLNWAFMFSADSQLGVRQRYGWGANWSWGGSYIGRAIVRPAGGFDYGASYKNTLMYRCFDSLELTLQPEAGYMINAGGNAGASAGIDWWATDNMDFGVNAQYLRYFTTNTEDKRVGAGAKYLWNDNFYTWLNYTRAIDARIDVALGGLGYFY